MNFQLAPALLAVLAWPALAQTTPPASSAAPPEAAASAPPPKDTQRIEITGGRQSETEQRRRATAAKTIIGREEIEQYGDSTVGEVLRRLPGVSTPGGPGRGGPPRLRGLGGGYTQLLIDGERIPRGFSLESITPDQVERIEILRAPTAETGARAIAGTINIVLREGFRKRLNDLNLNLAQEDGELTRGAFWTHNDSVDRLTYNLTAGSFLRYRRDDSRVLTETVDNGVASSSQEDQTGLDRRLGLSLGARLQWRLGGQGDMLTLSPNLFSSQNRGTREAQRTQEGGTVLYDSAVNRYEGSFSNLRLNGQWRQALGPGRLEASTTATAWRAENDSRRDEQTAGASSRLIEERSNTRQDSVRLSGKYSVLLGGDDARAGSEHSLVTGGEIEATRRSERSRLLQDSIDPLQGFNGDLSASSTRLALYAQNEWNLSPQWSTHAGLRWEGIRTTGDGGQDPTLGARPSNQNSVWTPLLHAVWKPDPASRSQLRASLTRSWRSPAPSDLIARPRPNTRVPVDGPNEPTAPDRAGNPSLRPELATGIDLAWEHYPAGGGVFSASLFHRRISDLMRNVTALETVPWSSVDRYVRRMRNVGDATAQGLELEAKGRLEQWLPDAPRMELRASASLFRSRVDGIPGPDNRLEQQPQATINLGADYRLPGLPVKTGGNLNLVPSYRTQVSAEQAVSLSARRVFDIYGLWTVQPGVALRLSASNLAPRDSDDETRYAAAGVTETTRTLSPSAVNWQLRLELKL